MEVLHLPVLPVAPLTTSMFASLRDRQFVLGKTRHRDGDALYASSPKFDDIS